MPLASCAASTSRKSSRPTVRASTKSIPARPSLETSGNHKQSDRHGQHAHVKPDQREHEQAVHGRRGRWHRHADGVVEGHAGGSNQAERVRFSVAPRIRDRQRRSTEASQALTVARAERPERIVHGHLRDGDRVGTVVEHGGADDAIGQRDPLEDEPLDGRIDRATQRVGGPAPHDETDEGDEQQQRCRCRHPDGRLRRRGRHRSGATSGVTARLPGPEQAHPPQLGEFALVGRSRIARSPWHSMIVSVTSGARAVPVRFASKNIPCRCKLLIR